MATAHKSPGALAPGLLEDCVSQRAGTYSGVVVTNTCCFTKLKIATPSNHNQTTWAPNWQIRQAEAVTRAG